MINFQTVHDGKKTCSCVLVPNTTFAIMLITKEGKQGKEGRKETFYLTTHLTHFIYGYKGQLR